MAAEPPQSSKNTMYTLLVLIYSCILSVMNAICTKGQSSPVQSSAVQSTDYRLRNWLVL